MSEAAFQLVGPAPPFVVSGGGDRKITPVHLPARYNSDALIDEREPGSGGMHQLPELVVARES